MSGRSFSAWSSLWSRSGSALTKNTQDLDHRRKPWVFNQASSSTVRRIYSFRVDFGTGPDRASAPPCPSRRRALAHPPAAAKITPGNMTSEKPGKNSQASGASMFTDGMFSELMHFFRSPKPQRKLAPPRVPNPRLAVAVLMVEAAMQDERFCERERA